jgi:Double zinc ribbon
MGPVALFGITNDGLNLAVSLLLLSLIAIWVALVVWTYFDARRRIDDPMLVGCATAASLFPFIGTIIYMIVRPPEYLADAHERELEILAAEARLAEAGEQHCPYCDFDVEKSFLRCPSCLRRLKEPCQTCGKPLDPRWKICPYCESEIGQPAAQPRRARRASSSGSARTPAAQPAAERVAARTAASQRTASQPAPSQSAPSQPPPPPPQPRSAQRPAQPRTDPAR